MEDSVTVHLVLKWQGWKALLSPEVILIRTSGSIDRYYKAVDFIPLNIAEFQVGSPEQGNGEREN